MVAFSDDVKVGVFIKDRVPKRVDGHGCMTPRIRSEASREGGWADRGRRQSYAQVVAQLIHFKLGIPDSWNYLFGSSTPISGGDYAPPT